MSKPDFGRGWFPQCSACSTLDPASPGEEAAEGGPVRSRGRQAKPAVPFYISLASGSAGSVRPSRGPGPGG
jgi:hypothetical protein